MKKILSVTLLFALVISTLLCSCTPSYGDLWDTALYNEDTVLGEGAKTVTVTVRAQDREVVFTITPCSCINKTIKLSKKLRCSLVVC